MRPEIHSLTSLRFLAAFWVFLFHIDMRWPLGLPRALTHIVKQGPVGMSLFFILSGFVLAYSFQGQSLRGYAWNRFTRIYPVYTLAALLTLPFIGGRAGDVSAAQVAVLLFTHVLMLQAWFVPLNAYWNFGASWSLSVEAFFYALFPFAFRLIERLRGKDMAAFMAVAYVLSVLPGVVWLLFQSQNFYYSVPIFRLPEFLLGVAFAVLHLRGFRFRSPRVVAGCSVAVLLVFLAWVGRWKGIGVTSNVVAVPAIALLIAALAQMPGALRWRPFQVLGRISYAFYAMQPLVLLPLIARQKGQPPFDAATVLLGAFVVLLAISVITYYLVEEPVRRSLRAGGLQWPWRMAAR